MPIVFFVLLLPVIEILLLASLASHIGLFATLLYLLLSALLGSWMLRHQKVGALLTLGSLLRNGEGISIYSLLWPLRYSLAGVLFIIPGVLSEIVGIVLLLPLKGPRVNLGAKPTAHPMDEEVIEGEFQRVDTPSERLEHDSRDEQR
ncbi:FxsA family protein [Paludibacterium purpuratum]|uniref:UPF0716 protein FxsA n=1 Tax=Paludibacterium purpuratum TaxID=1144873 RepID=A0A4R7B9R4_9NEIS|nr:FxsA family protein [Paludibacterium purpuratum]TDR80347.1 UPF0716 protein FxsA [Paludibacterium purpuratum]